MEQPITITCSPVNQRWTPHDYLETAQLPWNKRGFGPNPSSFTIHKLRAVLDDLGIPYLTTDTTKKLKALLDVWRQDNNAMRPKKKPQKKSRATTSQSTARASAWSSGSSARAADTAGGQLGSQRGNNARAENAVFAELVGGAPSAAEDPSATGLLAFAQGLSEVPDDQDPDDPDDTAEAVDADLAPDLAELADGVPDINSAFIDGATLMPFECTFHRLTDIDMATMDVTQRQFAQIENEIQAGRRVGARRTEEDVVRVIGAWLKEEIRVGHQQDWILDTIKATAILRWSSTRPLKKTNGTARTDGATLKLAQEDQDDAQSGRNQVALARSLGHIDELERNRTYDESVLVRYTRHLQDDARRLARLSGSRDILQNTILENGKWNLDAIVKMISWSVANRPNINLETVIARSFFLAFTTQTLMRMDDLQSSMLCGLHPWKIVLDPHTGEEHFSVVLMRFEGKMQSTKATDEPAYHFLIPHRDPTACGIGHLAAWLVYLFDVRQSHTKQVGPNGDVWDWACDETWRPAHLLPGREINKKRASSALAKGVAAAIVGIGIESRCKGHLGRKAGAIIMDSNGADAESIKVVGSWATDVFRTNYAGKEDRKGIMTAAGFVVGAPVVNPRLNVPIPSKFLDAVFPWVHEVLALGRRGAGGCLSEGTYSTLSLFVKLRKFAILHFAAFAQIAPESPMFRNHPLFQGEFGSELKSWLTDEYPRLLEIAEEDVRRRDEYLVQINHTATRGALGQLVYRVDCLNEAVKTHNKRQLEYSARLDRRTEHLSPSKRPRRDAYMDDASDYADDDVCGAAHPHHHLDLPIPPAHFTTATRPGPPPHPPARHQPVLLRAQAFESGSTPSRSAAVGPGQLCSPFQPAPTPRSAPPHRCGSSASSASPSRASSSTTSPLGPFPPPSGDRFSPATTMSHNLAVLPARSPTRTSLHGQAAPSTPASRAHAVSLVASPSLDASPRLPISPGGVNRYDWLLPPLAAFVNAGEPELLPDQLQNLFQLGITWSAIFDKVKRPEYLWDVYKPLGLGEYKTVHDLYEHWANGKFGDGGAAGPGRLPAIRDLEARFGSVGRSWKHCSDKKAYGARRTAMTSIRRIADAVDSALKGTQAHLSAQAVINGLLNAHGLLPSNVNKLSLALKKSKVAHVA